MAETRAIEVVGDYPHNVIDFDRRFDSEEACTSYLVSLRWPQGFVCPACGGRRAWRRTRLAMLCASCRHETSIIAGTLFEKTHKPLQFWFKAMWWVTSQKTGASALGLQRILGLGSYETAWLWLHKLRPAMVRSGRDRLQAVSRSMKPTVAALRRASKAEKHMRNRSWRSPSRCTRQRGSDGCACIASEIVRRGTSCRSCKERWNRGQ